MKKNILLFLISWLSIPLIAQITVTSATFPEAGDTLRIAIDADPNINLQEAGEDRTWNFESLDGPVFESLILPASEGEANANYPTATILTGQIPISETYYRTTDTEYVGLGFSGEDPIELGLEVIFKNSPPLTERLSPLNYDDDMNISSSVFVPYAWDDLPAIITDSIGGELPLTPDSIGIEVVTNRSEVVDAWGSVFLPVGNYEVLRVRRWDITETRVLAWVPFLQWTDVTDVLGGVSDALGADTTLTYRFYNDTSKEPIAIIQADPVTEAPENAQYKSVDPSTSTIKLYQKKPNIYAYPNPAIDKVRFDILNVPKGKYDLNVYNILGVKVWNQQHQIQNTTDTILLDVNHFKKGTYLYSLVNDRGKTLVTKRLIILRP